MIIDLKQSKDYWKATFSYPECTGIEGFGTDPEYAVAYLFFKLLESGQKIQDPGSIVQIRIIKQPPLTFSELLEWFPPKPIESDAEYKAMTRALDTLVDLQDGNREQTNYANLLGCLISGYDSKDPLPDAKPCDVIKELMNQHGMSTLVVINALGGSPLAANDILYEGRLPTRDEALRLAALFNVKPEVFLVE